MVNLFERRNQSLKKRRYDFDHRAETNTITLAHKRDMTYDFFLKHNMSALNGN